MVAGRGPRWLASLRAAFRRTSRNEPSPVKDTQRLERSPVAVEPTPGARQRPRDARSTPDGPPPRTAPAAVSEGADAQEPTPPEDGAADDDGSSRAVSVHADRLERGVEPLALSPTEALRLAREGRGSLVRRELPPDTAPEGEDAER